MHTAPIRGIDSDASDRFVLTCSDDKTAKLWDAASGALLKTLRVPAQEGNEGKLYACALSPDGTIAAAGGWTEGAEKGRGYNIYLFDTTSGAIVQRLAGMPEVIFDLEFRADGILAAALGGPNGIRIFNKTGSQYSLYRQDNDYGERSEKLTFDRRGRLASACFDGYVRLYDRDFALIKKKKTKGGKEPYSVAFSPTGDKLAVGYEDSGSVEVLDGNNLRLLYLPNNKGATAGKQHIIKLAFGPGGDLYGGGYYRKQVEGDGWWHFIRRWRDYGRGKYDEFKAANNTINDIKVLSDGSILMAGYQPDWGRYSASGSRVIYLRGETADFTNFQFNYLTVDRRGERISFKPAGAESYTFDIANRKLTLSDERYKKYRDAVGSIRVTDWKDSYHPKINGRKSAFLEKYETCRSVDIAADETILTGAEWHVYALDAQGKHKWRTAAPGATWAVNIAPDGDVAVAAHSNGVIRWYRMQNGALLLSLYVHPDGKRWVIWTPAGYYDASVGADGLVGWHINNGAERAADFFPLSRFAKRFCRPDVIAATIEHYDPRLALAAADKASNRQSTTVDIKKVLPPTVAIVSPVHGASISSLQVTLNYRVGRPSGEEVTGLKVLIDGRTSAIIKRPASGHATVTITVPPRDCTLAIIAENRFAASTPATVRLRWQGAHDEFVIKPKLYVLAIGVSDYQDKSLKLNYAAKDAEDFARVLQTQKELYREVTEKVLTDKAAGRGEILDGLDWILRAATSNDVAMVFLSGHGENDDYGDYYYLPRDFETDKLRRTAIPYYEIKKTVTNIAGKALLFIDTCHSGNVLGKRRSVADIDRIVNELISAENGVVVFASSTGRQYSLEDSRWNNGAFTKALVEGLSGQAAYQGGSRITVNMLKVYVAERVKDLTGGIQAATTAIPETVPDFPIALK